MDKVDAIVVGAGVVGLAIGRELAMAGLETVVVEAQNAIGQGVSSRNSEVIHAGLYYPTGSLKARLCVRGKELLYAFCAERGVGVSACGKLIVATHPSQHAALDALAHQAGINGVPVERLSAEQALAMEPQLTCTAALWSPTTGIVDSHGLMLALQGDLERASGAVALQSKAQALNFETNGPAIVRVASPDGEFELGAGLVVNAAGLHACAVARQARGLPPEFVPHERFAKGSYFTASGKPPFSHLVYPAPDGAWLGVHVTLDLSGQVKFGPDLEWLADHMAPEHIDYGVDPQRTAAFEQAIRRYWPALPSGALQPSYSGVRPKIYGPGEAAPDFRIDGPQHHGVHGLVNLFGIESPGLTSSMAIGEHVAALVAAMGLRS